MGKRNINRPSYIKTKLGWLPASWEVKPLGAFGSFSKGKGICNSEKRDVGLPCVTYGEIYSKHDFIIKKYYSYIDSDVAKKSKQLPKNCILFAGSGETIDEIGKCVAYMRNEKAYAGGDIVIYKPNGMHCLYLAYVLNSDIVAKHRRKLGQGYSVVHIYSSDLKNLHIPLPSASEQQKIAEILSAWDRAIEQTGKLIEAKKRLKKGLMQQLLTGRMRFSGFGEPSEDKNKLPIGWQKIKLQELARIRRGASPRPISDPKWFSDSGRGWIRISDVTDSSVFLNKTSQYLSAAGEKVSVKVEPGDLILSICATIGVPIIVNIPACIHDGFVVIWDYQAHLNKYFLLHCLSLLTGYLAGKGQPGTQKNLNTGIVGNILIRFPSISEQNSIVAVLSVSDREITLLKKESVALQQQKKGLMQKLMTGEVRVRC